MVYVYTFSTLTYFLPKSTSFPTKNTQIAPLIAERLWPCSCRQQQDQQQHSICPAGGELSHDEEKQCETLKLWGMGTRKARRGLWWTVDRWRIFKSLVSLGAYVVNEIYRRSNGSKRGQKGECRVSKQTSTWVVSGNVGVICARAGHLLWGGVRMTALH